MTVRMMMTGALLCLAIPVLAQGPGCMPRAVLVEKLEAKYGQRQTGAGIQSPTQMLEVWSSAETGSFTVFYTRSTGDQLHHCDGQKLANLRRGAAGIAALA